MLLFINVAVKAGFNYRTIWPRPRAPQFWGLQNGFDFDPTSNRSLVWVDFKIWSKYPYTTNCNHYHGVVDDRANVSLAKNSELIINKSYLFMHLLLLECRKSLK